MARRRQQKAVQQQQEELEEIQHGPFPVEQLQPRGIRNIGGSCYLGALLQVLNAVDLMNNQMFSAADHKCKLKICYLQELKKLFQDLRKNISEDYDLTSFFKMVGENCKRDSIAEQDVEEVLHNLLDDKCLLRLKNQFLGNSEDQCCHWKGKSSESFLVLYLADCQFVSDSFNQLWGKHTEKKQCPGCKKPDSFRTKILTLSPACFIIRPGRKGQEHPVAFERLLTVNTELGKRNYTLAGIMCHDTKIVHYYCYVLMKETWYLCNDSKVCKTDWEAAAFCSQLYAMLLVYVDSSRQSSYPCPWLNFPRGLRTVREVVPRIPVAAWHDHPKRPRSRDKLHNTVQKVAKELDFDLDSKVIKMLQISAEEHISSILETAALLAKHAGRSNVEEADIALALKVHKKTI